MKKNNPTTPAQPASKAHRYGGVWGEKWKAGLFLIGEIPLAVISLAAPMQFDLSRKLGTQDLNRDHLLASWTAFGTFTGAALGNITCAALDWEQDTPYCDLIGGLLGGLAGFLIADQILPPKLSSATRVDTIHHRVTIIHPPVIARPKENPPREDLKNPTDPYGP